MSKFLSVLWASLIQKLVKIQTGQNHLDAIQRELRSPKKSVLVINTHRNVGTYARTRTHTRVLEYLNKFEIIKPSPPEYFSFNLILQKKIYYGRHVVVVGKFVP